LKLFWVDEDDYLEDNLADFCKNMFFWVWDFDVDLIRGFLRV